MDTEILQIKNKKIISGYRNFINGSVKFFKYL